MQGKIMRNVQKYFFIILGSMLSLHGCPVILHNNGTEPLVVFNETSLQMAVIHKGGQVTFGDHTTHPHIYISTLTNKNSATPVQYELSMNGCAMSNKVVTVTVSDLHNNMVPPFFSLKDYRTSHAEQGHNGMPNKNKACSSCTHKKRS